MSELLSDIDPLLEAFFSRFGAVAQRILESLPWIEQPGSGSIRCWEAVAYSEHSFWTALWRPNKQYCGRLGFSVSKPAENWIVSFKCSDPARSAEALRASVAVRPAGDVEAPEGLQYFEYQKAGIEFLARTPAALLADEPGCGKTIQVCGLLNLRPEIKTALIICPASVKFVWVRELKRWLIRERVVSVAAQTLDVSAEILVINYDLLRKYGAILRGIAFDLVVLDEAHYCFDGSTLVATDRGLLPIREIVERCLSLKVLSVDLVTGKQSWKPVISWFRNRLSQPLVKVKTTHGNIICTANHNIYTEPFGYRRAASLTRGTKLRVVREPFLSKRSSWAILWDVLFRKMADVFARKQTAGFCSGQKSARLQSRAFPAGCCSEDDCSQSNEQCGYPREGAAENGGAPYPSSRGQWTGLDRASSAVDVCSQLFRRTGHFDQGNQAVLPGVAQFLPSRLSNPAEENRDRNRWGGAQREAEVFGWKKDRGADCAWVESVEIYKSASVDGFGASEERDSFVYDLEVADNHNYFAGGILVSNCKTPSAQRTKAAKALAMSGKRKVLLTGTPIMSRPAELWSLLNLLDAKAWGAFFPFAKRYCAAEKTAFGWDFSGASNLEELSTRLRSSGTFLRRTKADVLPQLPKVIRQVVPLDVDTSPLLEELTEALAEKMGFDPSDPPFEIDPTIIPFELVSAIRHETGLLKTEAAINFILESSEGPEKTIVFAHHKDVLAALAAALPGSVKVTGESSTKNRQLAVDDFQGDPNIKFFIASTTAMGVGITLTAAFRVIFVESDWTPAAMEQAEARAHRIGQSSSVFVQYLTVRDTIDERIMNTLVAKMEIIGKILPQKSRDEPDAQSYRRPKFL